MSKPYVEQKFDDVNSQLVQKATKIELQQMSLSYKESYATLSDLTTAYPSGNAYNHTVLSDGMIYTWNSVLTTPAWVSTNIQANGTGIANGTVLPEKTSFLTKTANIFDASQAHVGYYYAATGTTDSALTANADYTAYLIEVDGIETITVTGTTFVYIFYKSDGTKIGAYGTSTSTPNVTFTTSSLTKYVGISWKHSVYPIDTYMIVKGSSLPSTYVERGYNILEDIIIPKKKNALTVRKDGTGDFTTVYSAVLYAERHASQNNEYDIYICDTSTNYKGTSFDILAEMGGSVYLAKITDTTNNQKGLPLTDYVNLHGVGKVKLYAYLPDTATLAQSTCFSTIDAFGEFFCENLTFEIKNGRYAFHDESLNTRPNKKHIFENCRFIHLGNIQGLWSSPHAYAAGTSAGNIYEYHNCIFDASSSGGYPWDLHNSQSQVGCQIILDGCEMIGSNAVSIKLGFNGAIAITDEVEHWARFNHVFVKNIIATGIINVGKETTAYNCTNVYKLHNFTDLVADIEADYIA